MIIPENTSTISRYNIPNIPWYYITTNNNNITVIALPTISSSRWWWWSTTCLRWWWWSPCARSGRQSASPWAGCAGGPGSARPAPPATAPRCHRKYFMFKYRLISNRYLYCVKLVATCNPRPACWRPAPCPAPATPARSRRPRCGARSPTSNWTPWHCYSI